MRHRSFRADEASPTSAPAIQDTAAGPELARNRRNYWPRDFSPGFIGLFHGTFQPHLDQMQHAPIYNSTRHRLEKVGMRNAPEVVREVDVDDVRVTTEQQLFHLGYRLLALRPGRYAYCSGGRSASKIGSNTSIAAVMQNGPGRFFAAQFSAGCTHQYVRI
jgi:hypothetical protein